MKLEQIFFEATDSMELTGLLYTPEEKTHKIVISIHGMASNCMKQRDHAIAEALTKEGVAYFAFNNRGHDLLSYSRETVDKMKKTVLIGTTYEDILESYEDIQGAIRKVLALGYTDIYLQGHSLGCTKIVYSYQELIKNNQTEVLKAIKGIILLSMIDIQGMQHYILKEKYDELLAYANEKEQQKKLTEIMPQNAFIWPISVQTYLRYFRDNEKINLAQYEMQENTYPELNTISVPLMMRWGNNGEFIKQPAEELVKTIHSKLKQEKKDIGYIDGVGHNYRGKEEELAKQIADFIRYI